MEEVLDQVRDAVDGIIDFDGQRRAEVIATLLLAFSALTSFNIGYIAQDIVLAVKIGLAGTLLTVLIVVPPWPFFNKNPVKWLSYHSPLGTTTTTTT